MDYLYIRAWDKTLGSFRSYTERQLLKARESHAPETAIYQREDGTWATFEDIATEKTKAEIRKLVDEMEADQDEW